MSRFGGLLSLGEGLGPENCAAFAAGPSAHMRALPSSAASPWPASALNLNTAHGELSKLTLPAHSPFSSRQAVATIVPPTSHDH